MDVDYVAKRNFKQEVEYNKYSKEIAFVWLFISFYFFFYKMFFEQTRTGQSWNETRGSAQ